MRPTLLAVALAACQPDGSDSGSVADGELSFAADIQPIFDGGACLACHQEVDTVEGGTLPPQGAFDLSGDALDAIIEVPSQQAVGMLLVEPGDSLYSYLWHKVNGSQSIAGGSGTSMPLGSTLTEAEIDTLAAWIDAGAAP